MVIDFDVSENAFARCNSSLGGAMGLKFVSLVMLCMVEQLFDKVKNFRFCQTLEPPNNGPLNKGIKEIIPGRNPYTITIQRCHCVSV